MFTSSYNHNMKSEEQFTCKTMKEILSFVGFKFQTKRCILVIKAFTRSRHLGKIQNIYTKTVLNGFGHILKRILSKTKCLRFTLQLL